MRDIKHNLKHLFPTIFSYLHEMRMAIYRLIGRFSPVLLIQIWYSNVHHEKINLENPQTLDEKINWLKLNGNISLWTRCADKYLVRDYVEEKGLESTLNTLYGVYEKPCDIDFEALPDSFVLKTNNGGGGKNVLIVRDKSKLNQDDARKKLGRWLRAKPWLMYYEPQYKGIKPKIIAERYLGGLDEDTPLNDIKINCVNGKAYSVLICSDRELGVHSSYSEFDLDWNLHNECIAPEYRTDKYIPKPVALDRLIEYSEILSEDIPFVRVDWYEILGEPVFGEMTFTPSGGFDSSYVLKYQRELGAKIKI